jgi:uncharacterized membrane protein YhiD involved in acid resistance
MDRNTIYLSGVFIIILIVIIIILRKRSNKTTAESNKKKKDKSKKKLKQTECESNNTKEVMVTDKLRKLDTNDLSESWNLSKEINRFKMKQDTYIGSLNAKTL